MPRMDVQPAPLVEEVTRRQTLLLAMIFAGTSLASLALAAPLAEIRAEPFFSDGSGWKDEG